MCKEIIEWHRYPKTKPTYSGEFIVRETDQLTARGAWFSNSPKKRRFSALRTRVGQPHHVVLWNVTLWAEMPRGVKTEERGCNTINEFESLQRMYRNSEIRLADIED